MQEKLIDFEMAMERLGGDKEFLVELLEELIQQVDESLPDIKQAVQTKSFTELRSLAHGLKGASANLNADRMASALKQLENMGLEGSVDGAEEYIEIVEVANNKLREYLQNI
ncbi:MAG TPA: Hpt domain-containing protein [Caldithrix abyssi]|uniref:Hpt domain-containing protein n=1 Tax=Caldithrix abyssi TaxID=187145 RepID=A0A7V4WW98_CALAY|nr:Hpt domain-containing protein [Caldithrix abyssi]